MVNHGRKVPPFVRICTYVFVKGVQPARYYSSTTILASIVCMYMQTYDTCDAGSREISHSIIYRAFLRNEQGTGRKRVHH